MSGSLGLRTALLSTGDPGWTTSLAGLRHDIYQLPEYVDFASRHQEPGTPMAYVAERGDRRLLLPLIVRDVPGPWGDARWLKDATSPRGFPGPVAGPDDGSDLDRFLDEALASLPTTLREHDIVSAFIRLHPLLGPSRQLLGRYGAVVDVGESVSIDLRRSDEELWQQMRVNHRRDIERASRAGYRARMDTEWRHLEGFVQAFSQSMVRVDALPYWRLSSTYFAAFREALGHRVHLCIVEQGGALASASLITEADGMAEYHLAATSDDHVRASPSKLMIHFVCGWARERGDRVLHLAGSPRPGDALNHFKRGFSPLQHPVQSWRLVADTGAYDALRRDWVRRTGMPADRIDGYFPAYRKPHPPELAVVVDALPSA